MVQGAEGLYERVGYVLKQASVALRSQLDTVLRPLGLTVPQYACLELLHRYPGLSSSQLARGAFVSRQSMNLVLRGLQQRGLVTRPGSAPAGRALPTQLTPAGRRLLAGAAREAERVERHMLSRLNRVQQQQLRRSLTACASALGSPVPGTFPEPPGLRHPRTTSRSQAVSAGTGRSNGRGRNGSTAP